MLYSTIKAVIFVGFLTGFVLVLCIGNYYRAKLAMERQKQRRLARLAGRTGSGILGAEHEDLTTTTPPRSLTSTGSSTEEEYFTSTAKTATKLRNSNEKEFLLPKQKRGETGFSEDRGVGGRNRRTVHPPSLSADLLSNESKK